MARRAGHRARRRNATSHSAPAPANWSIEAGFGQPVTFVTTNSVLSLLGKENFSSCSVDPMLVNSRDSTGAGADYHLQSGADATVCHAPAAFSAAQRRRLRGARHGKRVPGTPLPITGFRSRRNATECAASPRRRRIIPKVPARADARRHLRRQNLSTIFLRAHSRLKVSDMLRAPTTDVFGIKVRLNRDPGRFARPVALSPLCRGVGLEPSAPAGRRVLDSRLQRERGNGQGIPRCPDGGSV